MFFQKFWKYKDFLDEYKDLKKKMFFFRVDMKNIFLFSV